MVVGQSSAPLAAAEDPLRFPFVEMLFALAVSQVAMCAADIIGIPGLFREKIPGLMHLVLSLLVIATSWVGWRHSQSPGMQKQIVSVFSRPFVRLLMDVLLVIVYFVLVKSVELEQVLGNSKLTMPAATPESLCLVAIFAIYVLWDLLVDVFSANSVPPGPMVQRLWIGLRIAIVCAFASLICAVLCYVVYRLSDTVVGVYEVAALDAALLMIVLLFRVLKTIERPLSRLAGVAHCRAFDPPRASINYERQLAVGLLAVYCLSLLLATRTLSWLPPG